MYHLIVIGSGVMGAFHAFHAARLGQRVLLLEKDNYPVGATVRNFGQVVPSGLAGRWFEYGRRSLEWYKELQAKTDLTVRQEGSVYVASDADEWQLANELHDKYQREGYACELLSAAQTLEKYDFLQKNYPVGALYFPEEVSVDSPVFMRRFLGYCVEQMGVVYRSNSTVLACEPALNEVTVVLANNEKIKAERVIICSGSEFRLLYPDLFAQTNLVVSKLQMLQTVQMPQIKIRGNILTGLTIRRYEAFADCPSYAALQTPEHYAELKKWGVHILFKQALDGSIITGDSHEYADVNHVDDLGFHLNGYISSLILNEAQRIVTLPITKIATEWAGFYAQTTDEIFEFDVSDRIRIITGIGGKGMTSSAGYAEASVGRFGW